MTKYIAVAVVTFALSASVIAQDKLRVFVGHTHTGSDQIGQMYALEVNQQLRQSPLYAPVAVPQDADVILLLTTIDPDDGTPLSGRRSAIAQVVTYPPMTVIDYAIDIVRADSLKLGAAGAIAGMSKALVVAAKKK